MVEDVFFQFEFGNVEGQQVVDFWVVVEYYWGYVVVYQYVGVVEVGWVGVDYCDVFVGWFDFGQVWMLVYGEGCIGDVFFY